MNFEGDLKNVFFFSTDTQNMENPEKLLFIPEKGSHKVQVDFSSFNTVTFHCSFL